VGGSYEKGYREGQELYKKHGGDKAKSIDTMCGLPGGWFPPRCPPSEERQMLVWIFERQHFEVWDNGRRPQKPKVVRKERAIARCQGK